MYEPRFEIPEFRFIRNELNKYETITNFHYSDSAIRDHYLAQYTACKMILKAFYDEPGMPLDILEKLINLWDDYSTLDLRTSFMFSTMKDYAEYVYQEILGMNRF